MHSSFFQALVNEFNMGYNLLLLLSYYPRSSYWWFVYSNTRHSILLMVPSRPPTVSKIKIPFSESYPRLSIQYSPTCIFLALILSNRFWKRVRVVYGFYFRYDNSSLYSSSYWSMLKTTFLIRSVFFYFTDDLWSISFLKFDGI